MASRSYKEPGPIDRGEALRRIDEGGAAACDALVGLAFNDADGEFVESLCLRLIRECEESDVRALAVTCIGHIARIHRRLHYAETSGILRALRTDEFLRDRGEDVLSDIERFVTGRDSTR